MKGVIVDIDNEYIIILNKSGDFKKICNNMPQCRIGDEIEVPDNMLTSHFLLRRMFSIVSTRRIAAAVIALMLLLGMGGYAIADYFNPVTFVTMDINPSIELILNRYERVLRVDAFDDEGSILAKDAGAFKNMKLEEALGILVDRAESQNYLKESGTLMLTISSKQKRVPGELDGKLKEVIKSRSAIQVIVENTSVEKHEEARRMKISQGKLLMYEKLKKVNPVISLEDVKKASISSIIEELKKSKAGTPAGGKKGPESEQKGADGTERFDGKDIRKDEDIKLQQNRKNEKNQNVEKDKKQSKNDDKNPDDEKDNSGEDKISGTKKTFDNSGEDKIGETGKTFDNSGEDKISGTEKTFDNSSEDKIGETNSISDNSGAESESLRKEIKKDISDTFEKTKDKLNWRQKSGGNGNNKKEKKK
ncbi:MAG: hypothetical protein PWQ97_1147 [Tepidanaerobacteraceae bacterium]|nr:hypothetical protein [Tepidanaerobacteraceae bacterium]